MKNYFDKFISRLDMVKEIIKEFEYISIQTSQTKK